MNADPAFVLPLTQVSQIVESWRRLHAKIVTTNGCFDLLHAGHVDLLEQAAALGDRLVVLVNSDTSVRLLKGPSRPINRLDLRTHVLAGIRWVDAVTVFNEGTPCTALDALKPDIHVKGGDYDIESMPETPIVRAHGGEVVCIPFRFKTSTTKILEAAK